MQKTNRGKLKKNLNPEKVGESEVSRSGEYSPSCPYVSIEAKTKFTHYLDSKS